MNTNVILRISSAGFFFIWIGSEVILYFASVIYTYTYIFKRFYLCLRAYAGFENFPVPIVECTSIY